MNFAVIFIAFHISAVLLTYFTTTIFLKAINEYDDAFVPIFVSILPIFVSIFWPITIIVLIIRFIFSLFHIIIDSISQNETVIRISYSIKDILF